MFNFTIFGKIKNSNDEPNTAIIHVYDNALNIIASAQYDIVKNGNVYYYSCDLGDEDLLGLNGNLEQGDAVIVQINKDDNMLYCDGIRLDIPRKEDMHMFRLDFDASEYAQDDSVAETGIEDKNIIVDIKNFIDTNENLLSSFILFKKENDDWIQEDVAIKHGSFVAKDDDEYKIVQKSVNKTTNEYSERETLFTSIGTSVEEYEVNFIYYEKKNKKLKIELPKYVYDSIDESILPEEFVKKKGYLYGHNTSLEPIEVQHAFGRVIIKSQVGDWIK